MEAPLLEGPQPPVAGARPLGEDDHRLSGLDPARRLLDAPPRRHGVLAVDEDEAAGPIAQPNSGMRESCFLAMKRNGTGTATKPAQMSIIEAWLDMKT